MIVAGKENLVESLGLLPRLLPVEWRSEGWLNGSAVYRRRGGVAVLLSASRESDGLVWIHASASRRDRVPNYAEMSEVKRVFIGAQRLALHVFPPASEHFNLHPFCLHLWAPADVDARPLPDFRFAGGGV